MEQTVNTFTKGLQSDTHPLILGSESLSNALNATLITQNGNEIVLQNDMGNARVDKAFLPEGYEPVGIKEYGGVIYVASYNPITKKCQIGSFPSPLRSIDLNKFEEDYKELDLNFFKETELDEGILWLEKDSVLILLYPENFHAGDKYDIYSKRLYNNEEYKELITDFSEKSQTNKLFTIQLGILNSYNEFIDITDNSELYFIKNANDKSDINEAINDGLLIEKRNKIATSTYSEKVISPLYLKLTLNHTQNFKYSLEAVPNINSKENNYIVDLTIKGEVEYNCYPGDLTDNFIGCELYIPTDIPTASRSTEFNTKPEIIYPSYDEKIDIVGEYTLKNYPDKYLLKGTVDSTQTKTVYDNVTKLYKTSFIKKYKGLSPNDNDNFNFRILVPAIPSKYPIREIEGADVFKNEINKYFLKNLSVESSLDFNLISNSTIEITSWTPKRQNGNKYKIKFGYNSIGNFTIKSWTFKFINKDYETKSVILDHKNEVSTLEFEISELEPRELYDVEILCNIEQELIELTFQISSYEFLLTTKLFDDIDTHNFIGDINITLNQENKEDVEIENLFYVDRGVPITFNDPHTSITKVTGYMSLSSYINDPIEISKCNIEIPGSHKYNNVEIKDYLPKSIKPTISFAINNEKLSRKNDESEKKIEFKDIEMTETIEGTWERRSGTFNYEPKLLNLLNNSMYLDSDGKNKNLAILAIGLEHYLFNNNLLYPIPFEEEEYNSKYSTSFDWHMWDKHDVISIPNETYNNEYTNTVTVGSLSIGKHNLYFVKSNVNNPYGYKNVLLAIKNDGKNFKLNNDLFSYKIYYFIKNEDLTEKSYYVKNFTNEFKFNIDFIKTIEKSTQYLNGLRFNIVLKSITLKSLNITKQTNNFLINFDKACDFSNAFCNMNPNSVYIVYNIYRYGKTIPIVLKNFERYIDSDGIYRIKYKGEVDTLTNVFVEAFTNGQQVSLSTESKNSMSSIGGNLNISNYPTVHQGYLELKSANFENPYKTAVEGGSGSLVWNSIALDSMYYGEN